MQNLTQAQIDKYNENIRRQNAAKRATNKKYYYKQEITTLKQLEKNQERLEKEVLHYAKKFVEKGDRR